MEKKVVFGIRVFSMYSVILPKKKYIFAWMVLSVGGQMHIHFPKHLQAERLQGSRHWLRGSPACAE